jgi:hypothetical protein
MSRFATVGLAGFRLAQVKESAAYYASVAQRLRIAGEAKFSCNLCKYEGSFRPFGFPPRVNARCPECNGIERHRMFKLWFDQHGQEFTGSDVLHIAPEQSVTDLFRPLTRTYISMDIEASRADMVGNIEDLQFPKEAFSCVICSHVLEHVDDRKALREMFRVLRPGGVAIILVPVVEAWARTYENPAITTAPERQRHFGQRDHVRIYGADLRERIRDAGFVLTEFTAEEPDVSTYSLVRGDKIFLARRSV